MNYESVAFSLPRDHLLLIINLLLLLIVTVYMCIRRCVDVQKQCLTFLNFCIVFNWEIFLHVFIIKLNDEVLVWLSVWSEMQVVCIWSS